MMNFKKSKESNYSNKLAKKFYFQQGGERQPMKKFDSKEKAFEYAKEVAERTGGTVKFDEKIQEYVITPGSSGNSMGKPGYKIPGKKYEGELADPVELAKKLAAQGESYDQLVRDRIIPDDPGLKEFFTEEERVGFKNKPTEEAPQDPLAGYNYSVGEKYRALTNSRTGEVAYTKDEQIKMLNNFKNNIKNKNEDLVRHLITIGMPGENGKPIVTRQKLDLITANQDLNARLKEIDYETDNSFFKKKVTSSENNRQGLDTDVNNQFDSLKKDILKNSYQDNTFQDEYGTSEKNRITEGSVINNTMQKKEDAILTYQKKSNLLNNNASIKQEIKRREDQLKKTPSNDMKQGGTLKDRIMKSGGILKGKQNTLPKFLQKEILKNGGIKKSIKPFDDASKNNVRTFINYKRKK